MNGIQRFFTAIVPARIAAAMEAESRQWVLRCPNCGEGRSVWEAGGIRYKAYGSKRIRARCPTCGERKVLRLSKEEM